jgi:hypothetical protein
MPPSVQQSNLKHYKAPGTVTDILEFAGPHFMVALEGWERIADEALSWVLEHTGAREPA